MAVKGLSRPWRRPFAEYGTLSNAEIQWIRNGLAKSVAVNESLLSIQRLVDDAELRISEATIQNAAQMISQEVLCVAPEIRSAILAGDHEKESIFRNFWNRWSRYVSRELCGAYLDFQGMYMSGVLLVEASVIWEYDAKYPNDLVRQGNRERLALVEHHAAVSKQSEIGSRLEIASELLQICIMGREFREGIELSNMLVGSTQEFQPYSPALTCHENSHNALYWWCLFQLGEANQLADSLQKKLAIIFNAAALQLVEDGPLTAKGLYSPSFWIPFWARLAGLEHDPWNAIRRFYYLEGDDEVKS